MKPFIFSFFLLVSISTHAQYCKLATRETNPDIANNDNDLDNDILDWRSPTYRVKFLNQDGPSYEEDIVSPFFTQTLTSATNPNVIHLDVESRDFEPLDGWELIQWDFGFGQKPGDPSLGIQYPFLVLYNKYESKLRYFFYTRHQLLGDIHTLSLEFTDAKGTIKYIDASLEHVFTPSDPIENYSDKHIRVEAPNEYKYNGQLWLMGEVLIAYDPCSCKFPSMYEFSNALHTSQGFSMTLESKDGSSITQIFKEDEHVPNTDNGFSIDKINAAIKKGTKNSNSYASTIKDAEKSLISTLNGNLVLKKKLKKHGFTLADGFKMDDLRKWLAAGDDTSTPEGQQNAIIKKHIKDNFLAKEIFPDWLKEIVPYAGFIGPVLELFSGGGKVSPPAPMMFNINLDFIGSGHINDTFALQSNSLYVPGSQSTDKGKSSPVYNNVLGVISVVEKPVLLVAKESITAPFFDGIFNISMTGYKATYKLKNPIKYALNPASGLRIKEIKTCLLLGGAGEDYSLGELYPEETVYGVSPWELTPEEKLIPVAIRYGGSGDDHNGFVYKTPYVPLECLEDYTFRTPSNTFGGTFLSPRLQITAVLEPIDNPNGKDVYFSSSYKVNVEDATYSYGNTPANPYINVPWNTTTTDINEVLNGNVVAWNNIKITGDFIWNEQTKKILEYDPKKEIVHNSTNTNEPSWTEILSLTPDLKNGDVFHGPVIVQNGPNCGPKNRPVDAAYLKKICDKENHYNPLLAMPISQENNEQGNKPIRQKAKIFPNPVNNTLRILYPIQEEDNSISIVVFNTLGRPVLHGFSEIKFPIGNQIFTFPVDNLPKGMYMVSIKNNNKTEFLKMVKL